MEIVIGSLIVLSLVALVLGAVSGRVRLESCCTPSDPSRDLRMRDAFEHDEPTAGPGDGERPDRLGPTH